MREEVKKKKDLSSALAQFSFNMNRRHQKLSHRFWIMRVSLKTEPLPIPAMLTLLIPTSDPYSVIKDMITAMEEDRANMGPNLIEDKHKWN